MINNNFFDKDTLNNWGIGAKKRVEGESIHTLLYIGYI
jgi:hypothetical protein